MEEKREVFITIRVSEGEAKELRKRMKAAGVRNMSSFIRRMALHGYILRLDITDLKEVVRLLRICSNNLNQYARKANESGRVYEDDILDLKKKLNEIWEAVKVVMGRTAEL